LIPRKKEKWSLRRLRREDPPQGPSARPVSTVSSVICSWLSSSTVNTTYLVLAVSLRSGILVSVSSASSWSCFRASKFVSSALSKVARAPRPGWWNW